MTPHDVPFPCVSRPGHCQGKRVEGWKRKYTDLYRAARTRTLCSVYMCGEKRKTKKKSRAAQGGGWGGGKGQNCVYSDGSSARVKGENALCRKGIKYREQRVRRRKRKNEKRREEQVDGGGGRKTVEKKRRKKTQEMTLFSVFACERRVEKDRKRGFDKKLARKRRFPRWRLIYQRFI